MKPFLKFSSNIDSALILPCLVGQVDDYWRTFIEKKDLGKYCVDNISLWWIGKDFTTPIGLPNICESKLDNKLLQKAGVINLMPCEEFGQISFLVMGTLTNKVLTFQIDGQDEWTYEGETDSIFDLVSALESYHNVVRVKQEGNRITVLTCKEFCGKSVRIYEGINERNLPLANVVLSCDLISCCCSDFYWLEFCLPKTEGCYWLAITPRILKPLDIDNVLFISQSITVERQAFGEIVQWRDNRNLFGGSMNRYGLAGQLNQVRLPIKLIRAGRSVQETLRTKNNGDIVRKSIVIQHKWQFQTDVLDEQGHDFILQVLKHKELYMRGFPMFYSGGYDEQNETASGELLQLNEGLNDLSCLVACVNKNISHIELNKNLLDVVTYTNDLDSDEVIFLTDESILPKGNYDFWVRNYEKHSVSVNVSKNGVLVKNQIVKPNCKSQICIVACDCDKFVFEILLVCLLG